MFTPRQQAYFDRLQENPAFKLALVQLDLAPVETVEYRRNVDIEKRVNLIIDQIEQAPKIKRHVIKPRLPWDPVDLSWVPKDSCPF